MSDKNFGLPCFFEEDGMFPKLYGKQDNKVHLPIEELWKKTKCYDSTTFSLLQTLEALENSIFDESKDMDVVSEFVNTWLITCYHLMLRERREYLDFHQRKNPDGPKMDKVHGLRVRGHIIHEVWIPQFWNSFIRAITGLGPQEVIEYRRKVYEKTNKAKIRGDIWRT